ncbi:MAG: rhomboid family intramembrane serine protease [Planctomycetes bacterium]|nr:rhomboid family intramembrane serine protease [Planctomycetota bacterium]
MGIYDRDYYRGESSRSLWMTGQNPVTTGLVVANVVVFLGQLFVPPNIQGGGVTDLLAMVPAKVFEELQVWRLLTAAFCHAPENIWHILWNMLFLWWFGHELEKLYGSREFLVFYLVAAVCSSLVWGLTTWLQGAGLERMIGASGAVTAVAVLYTLWYPRQRVYLWGIVPMEMWVLMVIYLGADAYRLLSPGSSRVAYLAHLAGAGYGLIYKWTDLRVARLFARRETRPRLRMLVPEPEVAGPLLDENLEHRMDEVLAKIAREGQGSLNDQEREILAQASRRLRNKRG